MTHTPGPWRIGDAGTTIFGPKTDRPCPLTIATLTKNDTKANGRLIAAAPALLEALEKAVDQLEFEGRGDMTYILDGMRAAIALAKGESK